MRLKKMRRSIGLMTAVLFCLVVVKAEANSMSVWYKLIDVNEGLFHTTIEKEGKFEPGIMTTIPIISSSPTTEISNVKAFDLIEQTELKSEITTIMGCAGIRVYICPILFSERKVYTETKSVFPFENYEVVDVRIRVDADYKDNNCFYAKEGKLIFKRKIAQDKVTVILPKGYAVTFCNTPCYISEEGPVVTLRQVLLPAKKEFELIVKAVPVKEILYKDKK